MAQIGLNPGEYLRNLIFAGDMRVFRYLKAFIENCDCKYSFDDGLTFASAALIDFFTKYKFCIFSKKKIPKCFNLNTLYTREQLEIYDPEELPELSSDQLESIRNAPILISEYPVNWFNCRKFGFTPIQIYVKGDIFARRDWRGKYAKGYETDVHDDSTKLPCFAMDPDDVSNLILISKAVVRHCPVRVMDVLMLTAFNVSDKHNAKYVTMESRIPNNLNYVFYGKTDRPDAGISMVRLDLIPHYANKEYYIATRPVTTSRNATNHSGRSSLAVYRDVNLNKVLQLESTFFKGVMRINGIMDAKMFSMCFQLKAMSIRKLKRQSGYGIFIEKGFSLGYLMSIIMLRTLKSALLLSIHNSPLQQVLPDDFWDFLLKRDLATDFVEKHITMQEVSILMNNFYNYVDKMARLPGLARYMQMFA
jgi:hypothetical protein